MYHWQGGLDGQTQESGVLDSCHFGSGCHSGFVHSLASVVRTGRCCLYPRGSRDYKASNKVRERSYCKTSCLVLGLEPSVACRCIACLRDYSDTHHRVRLRVPLNQVRVHQCRVYCIELTPEQRDLSEGRGII